MEADTHHGKIPLSLNHSPCPYFGTQINYVLEELHGYASLRDPETGIEVGPPIMISCTEADVHPILGRPC